MWRKGVGSVEEGSVLVIYFCIPTSFQPFYKIKSETNTWVMRELSERGVYVMRGVKTEMSFVTRGVEVK